MRGCATGRSNKFLSILREANRFQGFSSVMRGFQVERAFF